MLDRIGTEIKKETKIRLKSVAASQGKTIREIIEALVEEYLAKHMKDTDKAA